MSVAPSSNSTSEPERGLDRGDGAARVLAALQNLDRRWLYALLFVAVLLPLIFYIPVTVVVTGPVQDFYDEIERIEPRPGRLVIVAVDWDPQTKAENYPQTAATIRHLFKKRIPFAVVTLTQLGTGFCEEIPKTVAREIEEEEGWEPVYGKDWCNWGYRYGWGLYFLKPLGSDIPGTLKEDVLGTPIDKIPMMKGVKDASSVDLVCEFTGLVGALESWIQFFQVGGHRPKFCHGCTAVSAPSSYVFLDSGQLSGLLGGMLAAAEYEQLLETTGRALRGMSAQTAAHVVIIALIVLGNVVDLLAKRRRRRLARGEA